jgi:hypothetical protein
MLGRVVQQGAILIAFRTGVRFDGRTLSGAPQERYGVVFP